MKRGDVRVEQLHAERFVAWLLQEVIGEARGTRYRRLKVGPEGRFWLGRLAPEERVRANRLGERAERLDPCEVGFRIRPTSLDGRPIRCQVRFVAWRRISDSGSSPDADKWEKTEPVEVAVTLCLPDERRPRVSAGRDEIARRLTDVGADGLAAEVHAEIEAGKHGPELVLTVVNVSPNELPDLDTNLYEVELIADVGPTESFLMDDLPDSFRYDRRVPAYGVNGGVEARPDGSFATTDFALYDRGRPRYWDDEIAGPVPDLSAARVADDPVGAARELASRLRQWTEMTWSDETLRLRQIEEGWSDGMLEQARQAAGRAREEVQRLERGVARLEQDDRLRRAFSLANRAFAEARPVRHEAWRAFQLGYVLANAAALLEGSGDAERRVVDTLWFATGGGKTETYLLFVLTAAFYDRMRGKRHGITAWARFPLRMLSLQQTQRFADALAAAEIVRQRESIAGDEFSLGFFVGEGGSPNVIPCSPRPGDVDFNDPSMPDRYRVLIRCPFCCSPELRMRFDQRRWTLDHVCEAEGCPWRGRPLPFRIVDDEIYRFLPTVVLGTLDKVANVSLQAAMRGFYGAPSGRCAAGHGFTYAPRNNPGRNRNPNGCLFPRCGARVAPLEQDAALFGPSIRVQDELHLLRDSLGSIDSHYEALLDALQDHWGSRAKLIASSATLAGHEDQVRTLYRREGRTFPVPGPWANRSFWSRESGRLGRRYVGLAPRGLTLEFANDQLIAALQGAVRRALADPSAVAAEVGVPEDAIPGLVSMYGVDVVYGATLKDVEAAARSADTQVPIQPLNSVTLTGRTPLDEVRAALERLTNAEPDFNERIHLVAASSMLSHGVDIDRLNVMVMLGLPLSTSEFVQATARIGRHYPGLVLVLHKIARERDAAVFRMFRSFVQHMERLVDPVPLTARSRRVLELTYPGIQQGRIYGVHEPEALARGLRPLTVPGAVRRAFSELRVSEADELARIIELLGFTGPLDDSLRTDLKRYVRTFFRNLSDPATGARWVADLFGGGAPMRSLRDVEVQVPVYSRR